MLLPKMSVGMAKQTRCPYRVDRDGGMYHCKEEDCMAWEDRTSVKDAEKERNMGHCMLITGVQGE